MLKRLQVSVVKHPRNKLKNVYKSPLKHHLEDNLLPTTQCYFTGATI